MKQVQMFLFLLTLHTGEQMDLNPCMLLTSSKDLWYIKLLVAVWCKVRVKHFFYFFAVAAFNVVKTLCI